MFRYRVSFPVESLSTLNWLVARGYDGGFFKLSRREDDGEGGAATFSISESDAWQVRENVEESPESFLACSADAPLNTAMLSFLDSIV